jgi:signal transduction histidine kinase
MPEDPRAAPDGTNEADAARLLAAARDLAGAREPGRVMEIVRRAARELTGAQGVTFVLREGPLVRYADEDAISPLWKGQRFPVTACVSGWAMVHRQTVVIEDVYADPRVPIAAYAPTFVKGMAMVPVRVEDPVAAIGAYWEERHRATPREVSLLEALAGLASVALANAGLWADLRGAVEARDEFLAIASHELRTPLTPLVLQLDRADRALERGEAETVGAALGRMRSALGRLGRLVDELLEVSRAARGSISLERDEADLAAIARDAVGSLPDRERARVALAVSGPVRGRWDRQRLDHVVRGLLSNALKFGGDLPVHVAVDEAGGRARLVVRDHGVGISAEDQARIFDRFERAVSTRHFGGFGLGLWLVREVVEAHGGKVEVWSRPGEGSAFTLLLPIAIRAERRAGRSADGDGLRDAARTEPTSR